MKAVLICTANLPRFLFVVLCTYLGRAIPQAVSCWLITTADRVRDMVRSCGICGGQIGTGADFLRLRRFICHHSTDCSTLIIIRDWYCRPNSDLYAKKTVSLHPKKLKRKNYVHAYTFLTLYVQLLIFGAGV
jgi:hypothetical protein